jgi:hypothetical protein
MTRKDFELIAASLAASRPPADWGSPAFLAWASTVVDLADTLAAVHPRFDRERFIAAVRP